MSAVTASPLWDLAVIGESALLRGQLRSATVTTTGPAEVLRIEQDDPPGCSKKFPHCATPFTRPSNGTHR